MSADILRRAAALMRERAEAATPLLPELLPPRVEIDREGTCDGCAQAAPLVASYPAPDSEPWVCAECAAVADYEASWHPAVALAVADWLDDEADEFTKWEHDDNGPLERLALEDGHRRALTVARTYLGEDR